MKTIKTTEAVIAELRTAKIPAAVAENVLLVYSPAELRKIVNEEDTARLLEISGVGTKRAAVICGTLKGRIDKSIDVTVDVKIPDVEMYEVPELTLTCEESAAKLKLTSRIMKRYGPALQKLQALSGDDNITFTTVSIVDSMDDKKEFLMRKHWNNAVHQGIIMKSGKRFAPAIMGTNAKMKCKIHWADSRYLEEFHRWTDCGADMSAPQNLAKTAAYRGLLLPYTRELLDNRITPQMECIVPSYEHEKTGAAVLFDPDGSFNPVESTITNEFDGQCYFELTDKLIKEMKLNRQERRNLMRSIAKFNGGTLRAPWQKGLIVVGFHFHDALRAMGVTSIGGKDIDDIAIIGDMTIFKAAIGVNGLYEKFEDYTKSFEELGHRFGVLLENHGLRHGYLPSQQLQAACGASEESIALGAMEEVAYLNAAKDPEVAAYRYAPRAVAQIAEDDPTFANVWFAKALINQGYQKERSTSLSGRTHNNSVVGFVVKDPIAHMQWIACLEGKRAELPKGFLSAHHVYAPEAGFTGYAVASRNPVIAPYGLPIVEVTDEAGDYNQYFEEGFPYIVTSVHDNLSKLLRYDQDGDKLRLTFAPWFVSAAMSIRMKYGQDNEIFAEWESFGKVEKKPATEENMLDLFTTCTATPTLGLNVDMAGKLLAMDEIIEYDTFRLLDYAMNRGTDVKQGADGVNIPGTAGKLFDSLKEHAAGIPYTISQAAGKALKGRSIQADAVSSQYGSSNCDVIAAAVAEKTSAALDFAGEFDVEKVIRHQFRKIEGLLKCGTPENNYADEGLFNALVRRSAKEWAAMDPEQKWKGCLEEWKKWCRQKAIHELTDFAEAQGLTLMDVYDALVTGIFLTYGKAYRSASTTDTKRRLLILSAVKFLEWFGDVMVETYCVNMSLDGLAVPQPVECDEIEL